uniref:PPM-type phosphatase domain-containing protein n=1 Tax=Heterorhabditis bacteriophora TaxID=37862 RepID=A0A1I7XQU7_HETBA
MPYLDNSPPHAQVVFVMRIVGEHSVGRAGRGLAIVCAFLKGSTDDVKDKIRAKEIKHRLTKDMIRARLRGFGKTMFYNNDQIYGCVSALYQSVGIGGLRPNTILLNWPNIEDYDEVYLFAG